MVGSHALLLRLFQSQSYFSVHLALQYLSTYHDHIGITHYITGRLRELDDSELDDVWGFICHLLVTRPSQSCALETFVVERAEQSTHSALLTFWFMQTYLLDLSISRRDTPSFTICQRVLLKVQNIIFSDPPLRSNTPYPSAGSHTLLSRFWKRKIKPRAIPALVGMGTMLAGMPGLPAVTLTIGQVAIEQGRVPFEDKAVSRPFQGDEEDASHPMTPSSSILVSPSAHGDVYTEEPDADLEDSDEEEDVQTFGQSTMSRLKIPPQLSTTEPLSPNSAPAQMAPKPLSRSKTVSHSRTSPSLPRPAFTSRVFRSTSPSASTPSLHQSSQGPYNGSQDDAFRFFDPSVTSQYLRGHYLRSEVQFLITLESISNRLLVVPKLARVSALRAELTALNHKLPAELDIPMWTSDVDTTHQPNGGRRGHNRIVRIPPGESVVLNSAERAPYLLIMEVLVGDLDFDPSKRSNKELLKRIIAKEQDDSEALRRRSDVDGPVRRSDSGVGDSIPRLHIQHATSFSESPEIPEVVEPENPRAMASTSTVAALEPPEDEEEIDLVEQLYGTNVSVREQGGDLSDSIVLPAAPKNKALDAAAWSRSNSPKLNPIDAPRLPDGRSYPPSPLGGPSGASTPPSIPPRHNAPLSLEDYSERMRTAAIMLAQLNANLIREPVTTITAPTPNGNPPTLAIPTVPVPPDPAAATPTSWFGGSWVSGRRSEGDNQAAPTMRMKLQYAEATAIRDKIMQEMMALEEERMERMKGPVDGGSVTLGDSRLSSQAMEDESIVRKELNKVDPSAAVVKESWQTKKSRIRAASPYGHLASWDCLSVIVKTGADLRQEQMAVQLIQIFDQIWKAENCGCWLRHFRILITGSSSGLIETITDAVSVHSIKKGEYARRIAEGRFGHVTLMDHFTATWGDPSSAKFARAQRCFVKSLAGYSLITYFLQIKDRHNGNILIDREGHIIHIDFGFMLSNSPGNVGLEASPFKFPLEYVEVLGGMQSEAFQEFKRLFREGFEVARKHSNSIIPLVELMQKDSTLPCFGPLGEQTSVALRERFALGLSHSAIGEHVDRLIMSSMGSNWTRLYDSFQYYSQSIL
ncbi:kinase-like protein [Clavulina sp. PMI_390]|nr:kinase-like protein [Clavulina sp. PMI_390]